MQLKIGEKRFIVEGSMPRLPEALKGAILTKASPWLDVKLPRSENCQHKTAQIELAKNSDLDGIANLISKFPDSSSRATEKGFLRGRFTPEEYKKLIEDECVYVVRDQDQVAAFASVLPWSHSMLAFERAIVNLKLGPLKVQFCRWTGKDYTEVVESKPILYIADAAVSPDAPHAVSKLIEGLCKLRSENPSSYIVTTCSEAPLANAHAAQFVRRIGFERIGYVWLPARPMSVGAYPGTTKIVSPFQSGIWLLEPEQGE